MTGFLRRLRGGDRREPKPTATPEPSAAPDQTAIDVAEAAYEHDLLREEGERMSDLVRRQLRYAEYAWKPPAQGGQRRADDGDDADDAPDERPRDSDEPA
jgi:hypothetical protein